MLDGSIQLRNELRTHALTSSMNVDRLFSAFFSLVAMSVTFPDTCTPPPHTHTHAGRRQGVSVCVGVKADLVGLLDDFSELVDGGRPVLLNLKGEVGLKENLHAHPHIHTGMRWW